MSKSNTQIITEWLHNTNEYVSGKSKNFSYRGMTLYSYYTVIAHKYPCIDTIVMVGEGINNSATTTRHKAQARRCVLPKYDVIEVDVPNFRGCPGNAITTLDGLQECYKHVQLQCEDYIKRVGSSTWSAKQRRENEKRHETRLDTIDRLGTILQKLQEEKDKIE